jgi:uncharacterized protein (DUF2345 family)
MSTVYSSLFGNNNETVSFTKKVDDPWTYPDSNVIDVFSRLYVPGVYGKQLTAFEIASSGKIAITLNDVHTMDIQRSSVSNITSITTRAQENFFIGLSNQNAYMYFDSENSNILMAATNKIFLNASNGVNFSGSNNSSFTSASNLSFSASNDIYLTSECNIFMSAAGGAVKFALDPPNANIYFIASNAIDFTSADTGISMYAIHSNVIVQLTSNMDLSLYATSNFYLSANNSNVSIIAQSNSLSITASNYITFNNLNSNVMIQLRPNMDLSLYSKSNFYMSANNSNVSIVGQSNNLTLSASNIILDATSFSLKKYVPHNNTTIYYSFGIADDYGLEISRLTTQNNIAIKSELLSKYLYT